MTDPSRPDAGPAETLTVSPNTGLERRVRQFRLCVVTGDGAGTELQSASDRIVIGSDAMADLVLRDRTVSRFHCEIVVSDAGVLVRDLHSRNRTIVNGVALGEGYIDDGATLVLGRCHLRFELGTDEVRIPISSRDRFGSLVGRSSAMRGLFAVLERAAASDVTLLLEGETGTGKEAAAEAIHQAGPRRNGPLIVVDCGAVPGTLLESELFGHVRGAFTGAAADRRGAFEAANQGTLFLDEIGELGAELQPKLLRALERREVKRVGGDDYTPIDVRIIAATHRDLKAEVNARNFRPDLYYRLAVLVARLPPLRERLDDLPLIVTEILERSGLGDRPEAKQLSSQPFLDDLARHTWPGNVRELRNHLERCIAMGAPQAMESAPDPNDPVEVDTRIPLREARERWTRMFERRYLVQLLAEHEGNVAACARTAGVARSYLYRLLWEHGLR